VAAVAGEVHLLDRRLMKKTRVITLTRWIYDLHHILIPIVSI
jgi:hypothetical protein